MKQILTAIVLCCFIVGCEAAGPAISKSSMGTLELNVYPPQGTAANDLSMYSADIVIDGVSIGNPTATKPVLFLRRGTRNIRIVAAGCKTWQKSIMILGEPNHQVLNAFLEKE
jgi:hypothetical protein